jgi:hypothetical protein
LYLVQNLTNVKATLTRKGGDPMSFDLESIFVSSCIEGEQGKHFLRSL